MPCRFSDKPGSKWDEMLPSTVPCWTKGGAAKCGRSTGVGSRVLPDGARQRDSCEQAWTLLVPWNQGRGPSGESNHSWMTSTWKFFLSRKQRFSLSRLLRKAFIPFLSCHFSLLVPSASPQPAFPDACHVDWRAVLHKHYLGTMSLCIASICHSSGHRLPKESSFSC